MSNRLDFNNLSLDKNSVSAISRLFSPTVFRQIGVSGNETALHRLIREIGISDSAKREMKLDEVFRLGFDILQKQENRNEYVYKNALINKLLFGVHSTNSATAISEFRVGKSKADLVLLNGKSTAFEIKSERDKLDKLEKQVLDYLDVFSSVYVMVSEKHLNRTLGIVPKSVGVLILSQRFQISTIRKAIDEPSRTIPLKIFDSLRLSESKKILANLGIKIPDIPNTELYCKLRCEFGNIEPQLVQEEMVKVLKSSRSVMRLDEVLTKFSSELRPLALAANLNVQAYVDILSKLDFTINDLYSA